MIDDRDVLLTVHELAKLFRVRPATIYGLCRRGELPHIRIAEGRRRALIRFKRTAIESLLLDRTVGQNS